MARPIDWSNAGIISLDKTNLGFPGLLTSFRGFVETGTDNGNIICSVVRISSINVPVCVTAEPGVLGGNLGIVVTVFYSAKVNQAGVTVMLLQEGALRFQPPIKI